MANINISMNIDDWAIYYKIDRLTKKQLTTQMVYEPRVNADGTVFCMNFSYPSDYQYNQSKKHHEYYTNEFVQWMFERELYYLDKCSKFPWAPELLEVNTTARQIFIEWNNVTCNELDELSNYESQYESIIKDQVGAGIFKLTVYPHSHFIDKSGTMKAIDFYACCDNTNYLMKFDKIKALLGESYMRFQECLVEDDIDLKLMYTNTMCNYDFWPNNLTKRVYDAVCKEYI